MFHKPQKISTSRVGGMHIETPREMPAHTHQDGHFTNFQQITSVGEGVGKLQPLCAADGKVTRCSCCGQRRGSSSRIKRRVTLLLQQSHLWVCTPESRKQGLEETICVLVFRASFTRV